MFRLFPSGHQPNIFTFYFIYIQCYLHHHFLFFFNFLFLLLTLPFYSAFHPSVQMSFYWLAPVLFFFLFFCLFRLSPYFWIIPFFLCLYRNSWFFFHLFFFRISINLTNFSFYIFFFIYIYYSLSFLIVAFVLPFSTS